MSMLDSIAAARVSGPEPVAEGVARFEYNYPATDEVFTGHFPDRPILPGIFQIEIVRQAAEAVLNRALALQEIVKTKFQRPILPGEVLKLELKITAVEAGQSVRGTFTCGGQPAGEVLLKLS